MFKCVNHQGKPASQALFSDLVTVYLTFLKTSLCLPYNNLTKL